MDILIKDADEMKPWQAARAALIAREHAIKHRMCKKIERESNGSRFAVRCDKTVIVRLSDEIK